MPWIVWSYTSGNHLSDCKPSNFANKRHLVAKTEKTTNTKKQKKSIEYTYIYLPHVFFVFLFFCCFRLLLLSFVQLPELFRNMSGKTVRPKKPYLASRYIDNGKIVFCSFGLWSFRKCPGTRICSRTIVEAERNYQTMKKHKKKTQEFLDKLWVQAQRCFLRFFLQVLYV